MNGKRLLIVEDQQVTALIMVRLLTLRGFEVEWAESVGEAMDMLEPRPDCILLDLMLPDGDGEDVLRRVTSEGLASRVLVTTAVGDPERLANARRLGAYAVIQKPINVDQVCRICAEIQSDPSL